MKIILRTVALVALCFVGWSQDKQKVDLKSVLGPNNTFHDQVTGISFSYPAGWEPIWGTLDPRNAWHNFAFRPLWPSEASSHVYYRLLRPGDPRPMDMRVHLLEQARKAEANRQAQYANYRIDASTLSARTIAGRPAVSYVATGRGSATEYYLQVVGEKSFVEFYAQGSLEDVLAIRREIDQMAETVQLP